MLFIVQSSPRFHRKLTGLSYLALSKDGPKSVKPYSPVHEEWPISVEAALVFKNEAVGPASSRGQSCNALYLSQGTSGLDPRCN